MAVIQGLFEMLPDPLCATPLRAQRRWRRALCVAAAAACASLCHAQAPQAGSMRADDTLRAEPSPAGAAVAAAARNSRVEVLERRGFWLKVKSGAATGWVKMTGVATDAPPGAGAGSLSTLASGRSGTGNIVSASGTRGLSEAELRGARPDAEAVKQVRKLAVSSADSAQFVAEGRLQPRKIDYVKR